MDSRVVRVPWIVLAIIFALGVLWGGVSRGGTTQCILSEKIHGHVVTVQQRAPSTTQYRVQTDAKCTLLVTAARFPEYKRGDVLLIMGEAQPLAEFDQEFAGYAQYLDRQGIDATVRFADISLEAAGKQSPVDATADFIRRHIQGALAEPEASVVVAMILGDRGMVPGDITELFQQTGLAHILAISGLHLTIIAGILVALFRLLPISPLPRAVLVAVGLWLYVALVGFPISAQRAALFWTFALLAFAMRALVSLPTIYVLAAAAFISIYPPIVLDVGFQLSFAAVAGIGVALFIVRGVKRYRAVVQVLAVSVGATATTWPIVSYYFGIASPVAVIVNIFAVPVVSFLMLFSLLAAAAHVVMPLLGVLIGLLVHGLWSWIFSVALIAARIPGAAFAYTIPALLTPVWYVVLVGFCIFIVKRQGRSWREIWE